MRLYEQSTCPRSPLRLHDVACIETTAEAATSPALEDDIRELIEGAERAGEVMSAAVYFQRLSDGIGFSIGDEQTFVPASLLKLPVAFGLMMLEAHEPGTLQRELPYTVEQAAGCSVMSQYEVSESGLDIGQSYPLESMLRATIAHSDNLAYCILVVHMNAERERNAILQRTLRELGIQDPETPSHEVASVREYAGLFRLLYTTAYLDAAGSDKLLSFLSESAYDKGIAAGVPEGIRVANKFAERGGSDETRYLHDCGIVYGGDEPYVLCVMTKGLNFASLQEILSEVSSTTYSAVASGRR